MSRFRAAHASAADWRECVARCAAGLGRPGAGLGFVYFTDALLPHAAAVVDTLREKTGVTEWVGTVGIGVIASGTEYMEQPALATMVGDFSAEGFRVYSGKKPLREKPDRFTPHFALIHADPETPDIASLISDMSGKVESGFLVGGLSSSRAQAVQVANDVISGGLSGALFSSSVQVSTRLTQGCSPLPGRHRITASDGNVIATLDGRPALEVLKESFSAEARKGNFQISHNIHVGLPVAGSDRGDYLVRNLVGIDPKQGLVAIGDLVETGAEILFCRRDAESARRDLERILGELQAETSNPRGALYFSCVGRGENMFGKRGAELGVIQAALGDLPLVGFFCNGEISHDRLYGYTGVLTLFH